MVKPIGVGDYQLNETIPKKLKSALPAIEEVREELPHLLVYIKYYIKNEHIELLNSDMISTADSLYLYESIIGTIDLVGVEMKNEVVIHDCIIQNLLIDACWFRNGLSFMSNIVKSDIDYQAGGHNNKNITISKYIYHGFYSFFDCQFDEKPILTNNIFLKGCDVLYLENKGFDNRFENGFIIENNIGRVDVTLR